MASTRLFCRRRHCLVRAAIGQTTKKFDQNLPCVAWSVQRKMSAQLTNHSSNGASPTAGEECQVDTNYLLAITYPSGGWHRPQRSTRRVYRKIAHSTAAPGKVPITQPKFSSSRMSVLRQKVRTSQFDSSARGKSPSE